MGRYDFMKSNAEVAEWMAALYDSLPFIGYPDMSLADAPMALDVPLGEAILRRVSTRDFLAEPVPLAQVATLLHYSYGITRDNQGTNVPRSFRVVPSGGAIYPLEIYFHTFDAPGMVAGLYHYNPSEKRLRRLRKGDERETIANFLVQQEIGRSAPLLFFVTGVFERSAYKYGDRGYRFVLIEAGHVAQNLNLAAGALGLGSVNLCGYFDREADAFLGLDGLTQSTLYLVAVGKPAGPAPDATSPVL